MDAIKKFGNFSLLKDSNNQVLTAHRTRRPFVPLYSLPVYYSDCTESRNLSDCQKVTEHYTKHISDSLDRGTEEMPQGNTHPPLVHSIYFKQDVRLKSKSILPHFPFTEGKKNEDPVG